MTSSLEDVLKDTVGPDYVVDGMIHMDRDRTVYVASPLPQVPNAGKIALIVDTSSDREKHFNGYQEARFLDHPNLVSILQAGWLETADARLAYLQTPAPETTLEDRLRAGPLDRPDLVRVCQEVLSGLKRIHAEGLVCGALRPDTVWRVNSIWKLSDFSELRVPGVPTSTALSPEQDAPPESQGGHVTTAWDVWLFGRLLKRLGLEAQGHEASQIVQAATAADPAERPSAEQLLDWFTRWPRPVQRPVPPGFAPRTARPTVTTSFDRPAEPTRKTRASGRAMPIGAAIAALLLILFAWLYRPAQRAARPVQNPVTAPVSVPAPAEATEDSAANPTAVANDDRASALASPTPTPTKTEIAALLAAWAQAIRNRDAVAQMRTYGPVVDPYFGRHHVTAAELLRNKAQVFREIGAVQVFKIAAFRYEQVTPGKAVVSFDKSWRFGGRRPFWGSARERMMLRSIAGQWKIVSETETKVYSSEKAAWFE